MQDGSRPRGKVLRGHGGLGQGRRDRSWDSAIVVLPVSAGPDSLKHLLMPRAPRPPTTAHFELSSVVTQAFPPPPPSPSELYGPQGPLGFGICS